MLHRYSAFSDTIKYLKVYEDLYNIGLFSGFQLGRDVRHIPTYLYCNTEINKYHKIIRCHQNSETELIAGKWEKAVPQRVEFDLSVRSK